MPTRTSIEVHPTGCRLVEIQVAAGGRQRTGGDVVVRRFVTQVAAAAAAADPVAAARALSAIRIERKLARQATVILWGLRTAHQYMRLPPAKPGDLPAIAAREARKEIAALETDGTRATVATMIGAEVTVGTHRKREASVVAAAGSEVERRTQPLIEAGFHVERVVTPAMAMAALARSRGDALPGSTAVYVALGARATCVAIVRDGMLLFAREMAWGHESEPTAAGDPLSTRLVSEVRRSILFFKQTFRTPVETAVLCGDMPGLRDLAGPLAAVLELRVETLDSLAGIDASAVPEPAGEFRSGVAALRLAIAAGADAHVAANLLPAAMQKSRQNRTEALRLAAAVAASVLLLAVWYAAVQRTASSRQREKQALEQQIAALQPQAARLAELRGAAELSRARSAAVAAFASEGPRLARFLEAIGRSIGDDVVLSSIVVEAAGAKWQATVTGLAVDDDAAAGQAAVNALLRGMSDSPFAGAPVQSPALRVLSGTGARAVTAAVGAAPAAPLPDGRSGVEFALRFQVPK